MNGESELSDVLTVYIATEPEAPSQPSETAISLLDSTLKSMAIEVSWTAPNHGGAPITGYQLWMKEESLSYKLVFDGT